MTFRETIKTREFILTEGSVIERLRRNPSLTLHPDVLHAAFIYEESGGEALTSLYRQYMDISQKYDLPMLNFTPTWRADRDRLKRSGLFRDLNGDGVRFVKNIHHQYGDHAQHMFVGGLIGCRGDAYKPEETLTTEEAVQYHRFQLEHLAAGEPDFLIAQTLPAIPEALGIAKAMSMYHLPYIVSFIVNGSGELLDGTLLEDAIRLIDGEADPKPDFYMVNCVHPSRFDSALQKVFARGNETAGRLTGLQANTSYKSPEELDGLTYLDSQEPGPFGDAMKVLGRTYGTRILGGCCGSDHRHIEAIARFATQQSNPK